MEAIVLAVCLNGGPDKVYDVPGFDLHGVRRPRRALTCVGGKGNNFARVLRRLGHPVRVFGVSAGHAGLFMEDELGREGLSCRFVRVAGESRLATTILDATGRVHTEVNEEGPTLRPGDTDRILNAFRSELAGVELCLIGGSALPGAPDDIYATMLEACREARVPAMLDTSRQWLVEGARRKPAILKPNQAELSTLVGRPVSDVADAARASRSLVEAGIGTVLVTLGEDGALAVTATETLHCRLAGAIELVSAVASGDAFAAGYVAGLREGADLAGCLAFAVACGAANARVYGPGFISREQVEELLPRAVAQPLALA